MLENGGSGKKETGDHERGLWQVKDGGKSLPPFQLRLKLNFPLWNLHYCHTALITQQ